MKKVTLASLGGLINGFLIGKKRSSPIASILSWAGEQACGDAIDRAIAGQEMRVR
jgi:hypothetical protein